jgi:hypothetical protein
LVCLGLVTTNILGLTPGEQPIGNSQLEETVARQRDPVASRRAIKWSYADSPFCGYGADHFSEVKALFAKRPEMSPSDVPGWEEEWRARVGAMEDAMRRLDAEGLFGQGPERSTVVINVEVAPPDSSNTERAVRLNPPDALTEWLLEAAEV